ncbi:MAG: bifunctional 3'-5' exonuclease/DNA polymerase, partial [Actinobacteria bacterium]|nr:bifunctional 3'-5' exonuclease/DNA polymerase [Actinomycetota bacterium]
MTCRTSARRRSRSWSCARSATASWFAPTNPGCDRTRPASLSDSDGAVGWVLLGGTDAAVEAVLLDHDAQEVHRESVSSSALTEWVADTERTSSPRWVWSDSVRWYSPILAAGIRIARCHDLRLAHAILRDSAAVGDDHGLRDATRWDAAAVSETPAEAALFDLADSDPVHSAPDDVEETLSEFRRQRACLQMARDSNALRLLIAAESAGALTAIEMRTAGLPWDPDIHRDLLTTALGARDSTGRPERLVTLAAEIRVALADPGLAIDSPPKLLRALHRVGILVESTSRWELAEHEHPVIAPLIHYKKLARLMTANGWAWLDEWVHDGRFRPVYVPAGVVTGRWASSGGGALQIPRQLRGAVHADRGWTFVVADVAQLEPRVLAAMSRDVGLADAARGRDLYAGIVDSGAVATRAEAKVAMLGAMYGATTGESGRLVPRLRRAYPRAMALVDDAARIGEEGGVVSTWLGRTCPPASDPWREVQSRASAPDSASGDETRARRWGRDRGRFTRNFVVQGTAAEWALAWMADLRQRMAALPEVPVSDAAPRSGAAFARRPHLAFFLHDEIVVHSPADRAAEVAELVQDAAVEAGGLLFGAIPVHFPLTVAIVDNYG